MRQIKKLAVSLSPVIALAFPSVILAQGGQIDITVPKPDIIKIDDLGKFIGAVITFFLVIAALAAFIFLLLGGFTWITSGGDKAAVEAAQKRIQAAIIGLIIVFAAWAIMLVIGQFLGIPNIFELSFPTGV